MLAARCQQCTFAAAAGALIFMSRGGCLGVVPLGVLLARALLGVAPLSILLLLVCLGLT